MSFLDFTDVETGGAQPLKPGLYQFHIESVVEKHSKAGNPYLSVTLVSDDPDHPHAKVWDTINHGHPNDDVKKIAAQKIKQILVSSGRKEFKFNSWAQLISVLQSSVVWADVGVKSDPGYGDKNVVRYYKEMAQNVGPNLDFVNAQGGTSDEIPF